MADETLHAKLAFSLASAYAGRPIGPGPLDVGGALARSAPRDVLAAAIQEGCIGETAAAVEAAEAHARATDPAVRRVLERIAADEARHAALAWQFVAWIVQRDPALRDVARDEFARAREQRIERPAPPTKRERRLVAGGILSESLRRAVRAEVLVNVVLACADRLLGLPSSERAA
jgi:hypothetical protein